MTIARERYALYAVTDRVRARTAEELLAQAAAVIRGGAQIVQLREKELPFGEFLEEARQFVALCRELGAVSIINDNVEIARLTGADGVHVGQEDMAAARALDTDIIAVSIHWGAEYQTEPSATQQRVADFLFEQGADLIIGGHPHVPQPMELREIDNGDGTKRTGFLCYCLGNLLSTMKSDYTYLTALARIELTKDPATGDTAITGCSYVPVMMVNLANYGTASAAGWQRQLWDIPAAIADYESGDDRGGIITPKLYDDLCQALADCESIFGPLTLSPEG